MFTAVVTDKLPVILTVPSLFYSRMYSEQVPKCGIGDTTSQIEVFLVLDTIIVVLKSRSCQFMKENDVGVVYKHMRSTCYSY